MMKNANFVEFKGYVGNTLAFLVNKIVAVAVFHKDLNKTSILVEGINDEFVVSESYTDVMRKIAEKVR